MSGDTEAARAALRARQGAGARYDARNAPHDDLLFARRGTTYFSRKFNMLSNNSLAEVSPRNLQPRRQIIARISYQARELAIALSALSRPLAPEEAEWRPDITLAATLPAHALRHLFDHSAKHLDVEWRDLPDAAWDRPISLLDGSTHLARDTARLRAKQIWHAAVDLGNGGRLTDIPDALRH